MKTRTIEIEVGQTCKIDAGSEGMNIRGPAVLVILEEASYKESCALPESEN